MAKHLFSFVSLFLLLTALPLHAENLPPEAQTELDQFLLLSVQMGNLKKVEERLAAGANIDAENKMGVTPIFMAVNKKDKKMIALLAEKGANLDAKSKLGLTPLQLAIFDKQKTITELLLEKGAAQDIYSAASLGNTERIKALIKEGADVNAAGPFASRPLHWASTADVVKLLADSGADLNALALQGNTPLHAAALLGNAEVAQALLGAGADTTLKNKDEKTALDVAKDKGKKAVEKVLAPAE